MKSFLDVLGPAAAPAAAIPWAQDDPIDDTAAGFILFIFFCFQSSSHIQLQIIRT